MCSVRSAGSTIALCVQVGQGSLTFTGLTQNLGKFSPIVLDLQNGFAELGVMEEMDTLYGKAFNN